MPRRSSSLAALAAAAAAWSAAPARAATCTSLTALSLPHATVTLAQSIPAGSFTAPGGQVFNNLPSFCRVVVVSTPSPDSHIGLEVWLPASGWNGRYQQAGNGGFAGAVPLDRWPRRSPAGLPPRAPTTDTSAGTRRSRRDTTRR